MEEISIEVAFKTIYPTEEMILSKDIQRMIALINSIQSLSAQGYNKIKFNEDENINQTFYKYIHSLSMALYLPIESRNEFSSYVEQEINNFFEKQDVISKSEFDTFFNINKIYTQTFWNDLEIWKKYDIISEILEEIVLPFHNENILPLVENQRTTINNMISNEITEDSFERLLFNNTLSIGKEDVTCFLMTNIYLTSNDKQELVKHYQDNNFFNREDKKEYIVKLIQNISKKYEDMFHNN